jgi:hypothetical protein
MKKHFMHITGVENVVVGKGSCWRMKIGIENKKIIRK